VLDHPTTQATSEAVLAHSFPTSRLLAKEFIQIHSFASLKPLIGFCYRELLAKFVDLIHRLTDDTLVIDPIATLSVWIKFPTQCLQFVNIHATHDHSRLQLLQCLSLPGQFFSQFCDDSSRFGGGEVV
jgi:hypothetical protein